MIVIERRYQYMSKSGITWSPWFNYKKCETMEEGTEQLKLLKKFKEPIKKLKGEFQLVEKEEEVFEVKPKKKRTTKKSQTKTK